MRLETLSWCGLDEILGQRIDAGIKTLIVDAFEDMELGWMCFVHGKVMIFEGGQKADYYGLKCVPQKRYVGYWPPVLQNVIRFGERAFIETVRFKWGH